MSIRIAMIGAGGIARRHLEVLAREQDVEIVGHVARTRASAQRHASTFGGRAYDHVAELVGRERPDAAWITVPPDAHGPAERALLAADVPFLIEKPLSADRATGEELARAALSAGALVAVGYHWRALDTIPDLRARLADTPVRMVRGAWHDSMPTPAWWRKQQRSGGQMVEQATHLLDLARVLVGEADVVAARSDVPAEPRLPGADVADVAAALLGFRSGIPGVVTTTCALGGPAAVRLELICAGLHVVVTQEAVRYDDGRVVREVRAQADPFVAEDRAFLHAVRTGDRSGLYCDIGDALATHRLAHDVVEATAR